MNCPNCGNPVSARDVFCASCGAQIPAPAAPGMPEVVTPTSPVPLVMPEIAVPTAPVKKKSKKKKIIIITAIVTALAIIAGILSWIFIFSKESVWLVTSETAYNADGSKGNYQMTLTYTDKGLPLKITTDRGGHDSVWNDDLGIYDYILLPFDGDIDETYEFSYNEKGDILYYTFDSIDSHYSEKGGVAYHYDEKGRIESVDEYTAQIGGGYTDEIGRVLHYCYDDNGNLIEIYSENNLTNTTGWIYDFRYDSENRLIGHTLRWKEGCYYYQYEYNDKDQLTHVTLSVAFCQARLDNQHVSKSDTATGEEFRVLNEWDFDYDSDGNLISRGDITCTYDNGKLATVDYSDGQSYRYTDKDTGADSSDIMLVRDKNGNVTKKIYPDGSYVEYTYKEFRLSKEEAQYCRNAQMGFNRISPVGKYFQFYSFGGYYGFLKYVPIPTTDLMQFDILTKND